MVLGRPLLRGAVVKSRGWELADDSGVLSSIDGAGSSSQGGSCGLERGVDALCGKRWMSGPFPMVADDLWLV